MKAAVSPGRLSRRRLLATTLAGIPAGMAAVAADSLWVEPGWLKVHTLALTRPPRHRLLHFTDLHYKGDRESLQKVVHAINQAAPELVCFTGDLVEEDRFLSEALELLGGIRAPLFGVPGNHDYWSKADFGQISRAFAKTGGAWLENAHALTGGGKICIHGVAQLNQANISPQPGVLNVLLIHYPLWVESFFGKKFDLILAGHTHGGQVRVPFYGALMVPFETGSYDVGLFQTPAGPLYVGSGVGWFFVPIRFNCRPEIVVIHI